MWKFSFNFISLHYIYIISCALLAFPALQPYGILAGIDTFFFDSSASTESGLNTVDVKELRLAQQIYLYVIPTITNLMFVNISVVILRLYWFKKKLHARASGRGEEEELGSATSLRGELDTKLTAHDADVEDELPQHKIDASEQAVSTESTTAAAGPLPKTTIKFHDSPTASAKNKSLYIPPPRERDMGHPIIEKEHYVDEPDDESEPANHSCTKPGTVAGALKRRHTFHYEGPRLSAAKSIESVAASMFVLGRSKTSRSDNTLDPSAASNRLLTALPQLTRHVTVGRNSQFHNMTPRDRAILGGVEYRALKLLLKFIIGYLVSLHVFGVLCLLPWIHGAPSKYTEWLDENAIGKSWWAFYSSQTMVNNLGFTLTPDSMVTFRDATWPMLVMTFLAFAGNTFYPILLRLMIYVASKLVKKNSTTHKTITFILDHPRRCYTLLFPSGPTWILFGILFALNFIDVVLIIALDLDNPAVNDLPMGPRILSALFQAASSRHTGTATLNLAQVNPAVQFSLVCMMYIAIYPIAISIRASNTYEDRTLGLYGHDQEPDESKGSTYILMHVRNQLSFDLWYIFLGTFLICIAESSRIADVAEPAFSVFSVFFETVSAYGNVGLSLGHPEVLTSLAGKFGVFSKVVICAMMVRGRHRGLPYAVDKAIMLSDET
ncbi:putative low-affinity potassium transport protein 2 [Elsinoe fawcettii]|nr:putative low-affinity potassium transport protein 2 [Elsinoe fawcettii]